MTGQSRTYESASPKTGLVVFAPYPPAKSGIADYVAELIPYHLSEFDVTLVIADDASAPDDARPRVLLASEFRKHRAYFESAHKLYHMGNNPQHAYMLDLLGCAPGTVVMHDFNLCYLHEIATLRWGEQDRFCAAMEIEYGALGRDLVSWQLSNEYRELFTGYELPLNGDVLERATSVVTHSRQVQYRVAARVPRTPVWYLPHHLSPRAAEYSQVSKASARRQLGLPTNETLVLAPGFVTRAKQIPKVLAALGSLRGRVPPFRFVLAGERRPEEYDVDADIAQSGLKDLVKCTDYIDEQRFFMHLAAADIVVNLRYPSGGEMSGTLVRALGMGVPTVVFDYGPMGELPDNVVRKISWDKNTQASLTSVLRELMTDARARRALATRAATYARDVHSIERIAQQYSRVIRAAPPARDTERPKSLTLQFAHSKRTARRLRNMRCSERKAVETADGRVWWCTSTPPLGDGTHAALVISDEPQATAELLSTLFDWQPELVTAMTPEAFLAAQPRTNLGRISCSHYAFALVIVSADLEEHRAALLMRRLNAVLRRGASITVESRGSADSTKPLPHSLAREHLRQRLRDAGFSSLREWLPQDGFIVDLIMALPDEIKARRTTCISARKVSDYAVWRFSDELEGTPLRWGGRLGPALGAGRHENKNEEPQVA